MSSFGAKNCSRTKLRRVQFAESRGEAFMPEACAVCGCNILCNVSYFDVKIEEERNYIGYGKSDKKGKCVFLAFSSYSPFERVSNYRIYHNCFNIWNWILKLIVESNYAEVVM